MKTKIFLGLLLNFTSICALDFFSSCLSVREKEIYRQIIYLDSRDVSEQEHNGLDIYIAYISKPQRAVGAIVNIQRSDCVYATRSVRGSREEYRVTYYDKFGKPYRFAEPDVFFNQLEEKKHPKKVEVPVFSDSDLEPE